MNRDTKIGITLIVASLASLTLFAVIGCSMVSIAAHETLKTFGIESEIAGADVIGKDTYGHTFIIINGKPYEPRFLGLWLAPHIDYDCPLFRYESTSAFVGDGYTTFPSIDTLIRAVREVNR